MSINAASEFEALMAAAAERLALSSNEPEVAVASDCNDAEAPAAPQSSIIERSAMWLARREEHVEFLRRQAEAVRREEELGLTFTPRINNVRTHLLARPPGTWTCRPKL